MATRVGQHLSMTVMFVQRVTQGILKTVIWIVLVNVSVPLLKMILTVAVKHSQHFMLITIQTILEIWETP